jgi:hypothetical protein
VGKGRVGEWQPDSPLMLWVTPEEKAAIRAKGRTLRPVCGFTSLAPNQYRFYNS